MKLLILLGIALALACLWALSSPVDCGPGDWNSAAPDGANLRICGRPMLFAMPGQGSDRAGYLVLRDGAGFLRGVTSLQMARTATEFEPHWAGGRVTLPLHADMAQPAPLPVPFAWLADAAWRLRTAIGLVPADTQFR